MKFVVSIIGIFLTICISTLIVFPLEVYIIRDVATLFSVEAVTSLSKSTVYGIVFLIGILLLSTNFNLSEIREKTIDDGKDEYGISKLLMGVLRHLLFILVLLASWGMAYILHAWNF